MTEPTIDELLKKIENIEKKVDSKLAEFKNTLEHFMAATENKIMSLERNTTNAIDALESEMGNCY